MRTYTCSTCGNAKTESIAATGNHTEGNWMHTKAPTCTQTGTRVKKCTVCSVTLKSESIAATGHSWNGGTVTKTPTCVKAGVRTYTCNSCRSTKTVNIPATGEHIYGKWSKVDVNEHSRSCTTCSKSEKASHRWDSGVLTAVPSEQKEGVTTFTCKDCSATKTQAVPATHTHRYATEWTADKTGHWHACTCGKTNGFAAHTAGAAATEQAAQLCMVCRYELAPQLQHKHDFSGAYRDDADGHWKQCSCGAESDVQHHAWDDGYVVKEPTEKSTGIRAFRCLECARTKTVTIAALTPSTEPQTRPTDGEDDSFDDDDVFEEETEQEIPWKTVAMIGGGLLAALLIGYGIKISFSKK